MQWVANDKEVQLRALPVRGTSEGYGTISNIKGELERDLSMWKDRLLRVGGVGIRE